MVGVPTHELAVGVTVIIPDIPAAVVLVALNAFTVATPEPGAPILVFEFTQLKVVPITLPVNVVAATLAPAQNVELGTTLTVGIGFTNTVKLVGVPIHELADGVTVITPDIPAALLFVAP